MRIEEVKPAMQGGVPVRPKQVESGSFEVIEYRLCLSRNHPDKKGTGRAFYHVLILKESGKDVTTQCLLEDVEPVT